MSKRRVASQLIYKSKYALKYPVDVVANLTGTGTVAKSGVITVIASNVATRAYLTITTATNIGTIIGTATF